MSDKINFDNKKLSPFKWFVLENFPFIEADFDALTEWQLFCKLGKEINKIIDSQNLVGEQAETLTNAFNNLKNYVDNYFENLDVQDEINNKLNEMAETGELKELINKDYFVINLQLQMLFESGNFYQTQGIAIDNDYLYVCNTKNFPHGSIKRYNIKDKTFINEYNNLPIFHANDCAIINNIMYIATTNNEENLPLNKQIARFNINTANIDLINPFKDENYNYIFGITKLDDNNLICALSNSNNFNEVAFYILNINTLNYSKININTNNFNLNYYTYLQSIVYENGYIHVLTSSSNTIINLKLSNNKTLATIISINELKYVDDFGQFFGEFEGFSKDNNNNLFLLSRVLENSNNDTEILKLYKFNNNSNLPDLIHAYELPTVNNQRSFIFVDKNSTALFEDGTESYPFKTLSRAISSFKNGYILPNVLEIKIIGSGNYNLEKIDSVHNLIIEAIADNITIDFKNININQSDIKIYGNNKLTINNFLKFFVGKSHLFIKDSIINIINNYSLGDGQILEIVNCILNYDKNEDFVFRVTLGSILKLIDITKNFDYKQLVLVSDMGSLYCNYDLVNFITKTSQGLIFFGSHNYINESNLLLDGVSFIENNSQQIIRINDMIFINLSLIANKNIDLTSNSDIIQLPQYFTPSKNVILHMSHGYSTGTKIDGAYVRASDNKIRGNSSEVIPSGSEIAITGNYFIDRTLI